MPANSSSSSETLRPAAPLLQSSSTVADNNGPDPTMASGGGRSTASSSPDSGSPLSTGAGGPVDSSSSAAKKSSNTTETVRVPTSEHVAEIVGRQGCKIKALRAKTNTYIKTPARGEEPVFVVTGRPEDVAEVKNEILSAAEHFSQIRASRRNAAAGDLLRFPVTSSNEQVREKVAVPFWVVGLVVGPKGTTIRRIQQETQTYIVTPGKEKEPVFEIVGTTENVARARQEIESYIAVRMRPRQSHAAASLSNWAKLDNHLNDLAYSQYEALHNSSYLTNSSCIFDQKLLKESGLGQNIQNEQNWRHSSGPLGRPISVDVGELFRHFPAYENLSFGGKHHLLQDLIEKPQLEIEAVLSNHLSDLNLMSRDILKSFINHDSRSSSADWRPDRQHSQSSAGRVPFAVKSALDDIIDYPIKSITSFHTVGSRSQI